MPAVSRATLKEQLHSWIYFTYLLLLPYLIHSQRPYFFAIVAAHLFMHGMDAVVSDRPWFCLAQAKLNGFSNQWMIVCQVWNVVLVHITWSIMSYYMLSDESGGTLQIEWRINFVSVLQVLITTACTDVWFYWSHKRLHETELGAKVHYIHHCASDTSWTSTFFFHPLDFLVEFGGPVAVIWAVNFVVRWDPCSLMWSSCVAMAWYGASHDQTIFYIHHIDHHRHCDSDYPLYTAYKKPNRKDTVKHKMIWLKK